MRFEFSQIHVTFMMIALIIAGLLGDIFHITIPWILAIIFIFASFALCRIEVPSSNYEIERKFIVNSLPKGLEIESVSTIQQVYLSVGDEEFRIRKISVEDRDTVYWFTLKLGSGRIRQEVEVPISRETYEQLLPSNVKPIIKTRFLINWNDYKIEIDQYHHNNLIIAEVEFKTAMDAERFVKPDWFGKEVTDDKNYKNQHIFITAQSST